MPQRVTLAPSFDHSHWLIGEPGWQKLANGTLMWLDRVLADTAAQSDA